MRMIDGFVMSIAGILLFSMIWPSVGATDGMLHLEYVAIYGMSVIFFLYGLSLSPQKIMSGLHAWRVHLLVQLCTFLIFPIIILGAHSYLDAQFSAAIWTGFFFLAALPSTVSSSVAMTSLARGNVPAAIFNGSLSSLIGVFLTPLWMALLAPGLGATLPLAPMIMKIALLVLLPIALGQLARGWLGEPAPRYNRALRLIDRAIILAIICNAFSTSVVEGVWQREEPTAILAIFAGVISLFALVYILMNGLSRLAQLDDDARIACLFCASTKSLATGAPLAPLMFGPIPELSLILTPLLMYHLFQLIVIGFIAASRRRKPELAEAASLSTS